MGHSFIAIALAAALFSPNSPVPSQQESVLRFKFKEGSQYTFRTVNRERTEAPDGNEDKVTSSRIRLSAGPTTDGWTNLSLRFDAMESTEPGTDEVFAEFLKIELSLQAQERGKVRNVSATTSDEEIAPLADLMEAMMTGVLNGGFFGIQYPERAVKAGDKWEAKLGVEETIGPLLEMATGGQATLKGSLTVSYEVTAFKAVNGTKSVVLAFSLSGKPTMEIGGTSGEMSLESKGTAVCETETGLPFRVESSTTALLDLGIVRVKTLGNSLFWRE